MRLSPLIVRPRRPAHPLSAVLVLLLIFALVRYFEVQRLVDGSPYWPTNTKASREAGTYIADAALESKESSFTASEPSPPRVWIEHSYSHVRTGYFTSKKVVDPERRVRALFEGTTLVRTLAGEWRVEVNGEPQFAALASEGAIVDGFLGGPETTHRIRLAAPSGESVEWIFRFRDLDAM